MAETIFAGPQVTFESDRAVAILGHSERREVGELWENTLERSGLFPRDIEVRTLNRSADPIGRLALRSLLKDSVLFTHSAGMTRVRQALQIVAFNSPESVATKRELIDCAVAIGKDEMINEPGCHETGFMDYAKAGLQLITSPFTTYRTMDMITNGYSTVDRLVNGAEDFPAGRAMVHTMRDGFGFAEKAFARLDELTDADVSSAWLPNYHHNELLFAPAHVIEETRGHIFPVDMPQLVD